ncbi:MAG: DUF4388 domain-containing protein [Candidatus Aminicenantaceae bacterium]
MNELPLQGNLAETPLPQLLFSIWHKEKTGLLRITKEKIEKKLYFKKRNIVGELASFSEKDFLKMLIKKKMLNSSQLKKCRLFARQNKITVIKSLTEFALFSPLHLWQLMQTFFKEDFFSLFDWTDAEFYFESEDIPYESQILQESEIPNLILQGIRQMKNREVFEIHLPPEDESLKILFPFYIDQIRFEPHEKYLLKLIENAPNLKIIYDLSEIGKGETKRTIFAFLSLGIISTSHENKRVNYAHEFLTDELDKILESFNSKCSYIYKYISKEIGPAAMSVLNKCLDDIKPQLSPPLQTLELRPDGRIEMKPTLRMNINLSSDKKWKNFLKDLDEILAAEVLAVKRTLGTGHETALIENLEKMGDLS